MWVANRPFNRKKKASPAVPKMPSRIKKSPRREREMNSKPNKKNNQSNKIKAVSPSKGKLRSRP